MDKESILDAIIEIADALQSARYEQERAEREEENEANKRDVGYPVGTKLFSFSYEDGVEQVEVVGKQKVKEGRHSRYCLESDVFAESPSEAIRKMVESWRENGELQTEEDVAHFEYDIKYHSERVEWAKMAIAAIKEAKST